MWSCATVIFTLGVCLPPLNVPANIRSLQGAWIFSLLHYSVPTYGDYVYPGWANVIGWILAVSSSIPIPLGMLHQLYKTEGTIIQVRANEIKASGFWNYQHFFYQVAAESRLASLKWCRKPEDAVKTTA